MATNYEKYFGTPEKVAENIMKCEPCDFCNRDDAGDGCETHPECQKSFLEYLQEECDE